MSIQVRSELEETIKGYMIVGETLDGLHTYFEYQFRNLFTSLILFIATLFATGQAINQGSIWYILSPSFFVGFIYFSIKFRIKLTYAVTTFRIIQIIEADIISKFMFRSSRLVGFSDLHYEHVESISVSTPPISMPRFYVSLFLISIGWLLLGDFASLNTQSLDLASFIALFLIVVGAINVVFSLPTGGVRLIVQSVSGDKMEFPEGQTPEKFIDDLILNCRTFLSYGAK